MVFQLLSFIIQEDLLFSLANNIHRLPFESRKDAQVVFSTAFRYKPVGASDPQVLHHVIQFRPEIIISLCKGYDRRESAMPCGGVLREALKYDSIAALLLYDEPATDGKTRDLGDVNPDSAPATGVTQAEGQALLARAATIWRAEHRAIEALLPDPTATRQALRALEDQKA